MPIEVEDRIGLLEAADEDAAEETGTPETATVTDPPPDPTPEETHAQMRAYVSNVRLATSRYKGAANELYAAVVAMEARLPAIEGWLIENNLPGVRAAVGPHELALESSLDHVISISGVLRALLRSCDDPTFKECQDAHQALTAKALEAKRG